MKKQLITLTFALCVWVGLSAQQETLFNRTRVVGGFGGPIVEIGLDDNYNTAIGGGGGVIINSFFIGAYGMASLDFEQLLEENGDIDNLELGHGGLWLGFNIGSNKLVHLYGSTRVGWGAVDVSLTNNTRYEDLDQVFLVTPEAGIELNLTRWFRIAGTVGYRFMDGANETRGYTNDDFKGTFAGITLRFGGFGSNRWNDNDW